MGIGQRFREIIKSVVVAMGSLFTFTGFFVLIYITFDYQSYLQHHQSTQISEINTIQKKHESSLDALKKLVEVTCIRVKAARSDIDRLRSVLNSLHNLDTSHSMVNFQKVAYIKVTEPHTVVGRFGVLPSQEKPPQGILNSIHQHGFTSVFEDNALKVYGAVKDGKDPGDPHTNIIGILEVQINRDAYLKSLGTYQTVDFVPDISQDLQNSSPSPILENPIPIYEKPPQSFSSYCIAHKSHYAIFAIFALFIIFFVIRYLHKINNSLKSMYQEKLDNLEENVAQLTTSRTNLSQKLTKLQEDTKAHYAACQAKKDLMFKITVRRKLQEQHLNETLINAVREIKNPNAELSYLDYEHVLSYCLKESTALFGEFLDKDPLFYELFLEEVIESVQVLFADKIRSNRVQVTVDFPEDDNDPFGGDPLLTKLLLMQILGQAIYSVPADGFVSIRVRKIESTLKMEIRHNGFPITERIEQLFRKHFELFLNNDMIQHICKECSIVCTYTKVCSGDNVTHLEIPLEIPKSQETINENTNVVPLFQ